MGKHTMTTERFRDYLQAEYDACEDAEEKLHAIPPKFLTRHDLVQILNDRENIMLSYCENNLDYDECYDMGDEGMVSGEDILLID
tara:strand:- start:268 stop:522 length:255 start_codon:yes stop_codon:yes gene_type:complete